VDLQGHQDQAVQVEVQDHQVNLEVLEVLEQAVHQVLQDLQGHLGQVGLAEVQVHQEYLYKY
jgi:hypothetical protein